MGPVAAATVAVVVVVGKVPQVEGVLAVQVARCCTSLCLSAVVVLAKCRYGCNAACYRDNAVCVRCVCSVV